MSKYKKSLVSKIQEQKVEEKKQIELKSKHGIEADANVVVVEKSNMVKFFISAGATVVRSAAQIIILVLAVIGLMTLIYPNIRIPFWELLDSLKEEVISFV